VVTSVERATGSGPTRPSQLAAVPADLSGPTAEVVVITTAGVRSAPRPIPVARHTSIG
jgi:hypothetical protein